MNENKENNYLLKYGPVLMDIGSCLIIAGMVVALALAIAGTGGSVVALFFLCGIGIVMYGCSNYVSRPNSFTPVGSMSWSAISWIGEKLGLISRKKSQHSNVNEHVPSSTQSLNQAMHSSSGSISQEAPVQANETSFSISGLIRNVGRLFGCASDNSVQEPEIVRTHYNKL